MGQCYNTTIIKAPADQVWAVVRDFHDMSWAEPVIESLEPVGDRAGTEPGAGRVLNGVFHETLQSIDEDSRTFAYSIDHGPGPVHREAVDNYRGILKVFPVTDSGQAFVEWQSLYDSDDPDAVAEFCDPIYQALLKALRSHFD